MWANIYACRNCGQTWQVETIESIDCERDSVEHHLVCQICGADVCEELKTPEGHQLVHLLTESEIERISAPDHEGEEPGPDDF